MPHFYTLERIRELGWQPVGSDLVLVPRVPTKAMLEAATQAMRRRQEELGEDWFPVSNKVKALIRWEAMLAVLDAERAKLKESE